MSQALGVSWTEAWLTVVVAVAIYLAMIALSRVFGQRSFTTSSTYDLALIFALGSVMGRVVLVRTSLGAALIGLATLFGLHRLTAYLHHHVDPIHRLIQNAPILLVADGELQHDLLERANTSVVEVHQTLRLHGKGGLDQVRAVVLERNGRMSVIDRETPLDREVLVEVVGAERLVGTSRA